MKYNLASLYMMLEDGKLEEILNRYDYYLDFLEDTYFFEGDIWLDNTYIERFENIIIDFYTLKHQKEI